MSEQFEPKGKKATVYFTSENSQVSGVVKYTPVATGDSWVLETENEIVYVQTFESIHFEKGGENAGQ